MAAAPPPAPEPPPPPKDPLPDAVEAVVRLYEAIGSAPASSTCHDLAGATRRLIAASAGDLATVRTAAASPRRDEVDAMLTAAGPRLTTAMAGIDAALARCEAEPELARALESITREEPR